MTCHVCGNALRPTKTDLPFKVAARSIVIFKQLPIAQCEGCIQYLIDDAVMARIDELLSKADKSLELEIIPFAA